VPRRRPRLALFALLIALQGCSGLPSAPTSGGQAPSTAPSFEGVTVSAIDGQPIAGVTVKIGSQTAVSDANGAFGVQNVGSGSQTAILMSASVVERHKLVTTPSLEPARESLIPGIFDLVAFDQMFRSGNAGLQRWTSAPSLVVLTTVMKYANALGGQDEYYATSEQLTEEETTVLIDQLTQGLGLLTGNTFTSFAAIERESVSSGTKVSTLRSGKIVIGRYQGIVGLINTIGFGRWATDDSGQVIGGAVYLDRDFDKSSEARRLLRTHELGHALGYGHVTARTSIMNPSIGPEPTTFDRQGAVIAFQRLPGNQSPDTDPGTSPASGGPLGMAPGISSPVWSPPIICGPRPQ
jgi:hypothetical protein